MLKTILPTVASAGRTQQVILRSSYGVLFNKLILSGRTCVSCLTVGGCLYQDGAAATVQCVADAVSVQGVRPFSERGPHVRVALADRRMVHVYIARQISRSAHRTHSLP